MQDNVIDSGDVLIIGAGLAGLSTALALKGPRATIVSAAPLLSGASSAWAQGGIAAAIGPDDSPDQHLADTIAAGAGLVEPAAARLLAEAAPERIGALEALGVRFDRAPSGAYRLNREAAHSRARVARIDGDRTGAGLMEALVRTVRGRSDIACLDGILIRDLAVSEGRVVGAFGVRASDGGGLVYLKARAVVLATGGVGGLYAVTTNPREASGTGLGLAARAGAVVADPEFVQFHPTALAIGADPAPLATEALRGEGAILLNDEGVRFMPSVHPQAELAPRDIVARAIQSEIGAGRAVFLDCRDAIGPAFAERFPTVHALCTAHGIDPVRMPIPVAPAAHYHMGGVATDLDARTSVQGLWAVGECASTGVHGANRLASNSLLECLVFGDRAGADISGELKGASPARFLPAPPPGPRARSSDAEPIRPQIERLRRVMTQGAGVVRSGASLTRVAREIADIERQAEANPVPVPAIDDMLAAAKLIVAAALSRTESRGAHARTDYPQTNETGVHSRLTLAEAEAVLAGARTGAAQASGTVAA
ncbi:MAG: L-aspartate oxidase [Alphaproteobacteria bacterium]|nr:L-aspartate oxidase [Alphaproteobacteria bacterium]